MTHEIYMEGKNYIDKTANDETNNVITVLNLVKCFWD